MLQNAKSVISFALPLNKEKIRTFLKKENRVDHELDNIQTNVDAYLMGNDIADMLIKRGYESKVIFPNFKYRTDVPGWQMKMHPELSLRFIAVRSGVASFGWSGNVGLKGYGATIILGGLVTSAELQSTSPIPEEDSFCNQCKLCQNVCSFRMFDGSEREKISIGEYEFEYAKRNNIMRCQIVCGGLSGLDKRGQWSTWSPGRFPYPEDDSQVRKIFRYTILNSHKRPKDQEYDNNFDISQIEGEIKVTDVNTGGDLSKEMLRTIKLTCGNCQLICWGDPKETKKNFQLLKNSGCVIQYPNGEIKVLPPEEALDTFQSFPKKHRKLYYKEF